MKKIYLILICVASLRADQFSILYYNDFFAKTDEHFTNGLGGSWLDDPFEPGDQNRSNAYSALWYGLLDAVSLRSADTPKKYTAGIGISQMMVTPADLTQTVPQYDDMPYAGYLALSTFLFEWDNVSFTEYRIEGGVVGKESGAEWLQKKIHKIGAKEEPMGWDTQLGTDWMVNLLYRKGYKTWRSRSESGLMMDWFNHFGVQLGNFTTDLFAGTMFRFGQNYIENFNLGYPYLREEASSLFSYKKHHGFGWSLSVGISGELLAYSYIIEKGQEEGYLLDDNIVNISPYGGVSLYYDDFKMTFFYQARSYSMIDDSQIDTFGGLKFLLPF